ncbi:DNA polymerase III, delta subunit [Candidatus Methylomirabilis lanthanidiphila]|uniref:DNA polymerase III subunit delta n=1 Tax=Candidatus Methylomirabilis lanthanidiphila TaxID=2211376 RepID=A0A564ZHC1_9BACT|nr:DNA polymerase III subunit delta [Candidatus Methylomirabilis lanthanidiphila]VUZ83948.1 DNA polymerase III, delta subunit [Candidatus Methylomirabilis lanthanidiphila]
MGRWVKKSHSVADQVRRGEVASVYCLYGEEEYRREQELNQLLDALLMEGVRELNLDQIRPGETGTGSILGSARTLPFLASRRVVLVRGIEELSREQQEELLAYLNDPCPTSCLVLTARRLDLRTRLAAALQKKGVLLRFDRLETDSLKESLTAAARERGVRLRSEAVSLLIALVGDDFRQLIYNVEKLALFVGEREEIGAKDVEALVGETRVRSIFQLTDAVSSKSLDVALRCLTSLLESGEEPLAVIGMLGRQIRLLVRAKALREQSIPVSRMTHELNLPPRVTAALAEQSASRSWRELSGALQSLSETDLAIKTGRAAAPVLLTGLVWDLCRA